MPTIKFTMEQEKQNGAVIKVVGIGGAGNNALRRMIDDGISGVEFIGINTDAQALKKLEGYRTIQIGSNLTRGLGAGGNPVTGRDAAEESREDLKKAFEGADLIITTYGGGGGTGTGAGPICVDIARETGALTISIVTRPFSMEGTPRQTRAEEGIRALREVSDTVVVIPNQRLIDSLDGKDIKLREAFFRVDSVLMQATRGISELLTTTGEVNLDFNDLHAVMKNGGDALLGFGSASGENRSTISAEKAITSPFLDEMNIAGANALLVNISASSEVGMREVDEAVRFIKEKTGKEETEVFTGFTYNEKLGDEFQITLIATGINQSKPKPKQEAMTLETKPLQNGFRTPIAETREMDTIDRILSIPRPVPYQVNGNGKNGNTELPSRMK